MKARESWPSVRIAEGISVEDVLREPPEAFFGRVLDALWEEEKRELRLSIYFCSDAEMHRLQERFLGEDAPTDVLSFPLRNEIREETSAVQDAANAARRRTAGEQAAELADGEVVVNVDFARRSAHDSGNSEAAELALYVVHGALHLLGYDDRDTSTLAHMKHAEQRVLVRLDLAIGERYD